MRKRDRDAMGRALESIESALDKYALAHLEAYESPIGEDGVLGPAWLKILKGAEALLDGETGYYEPTRAWVRLDKLAKAHGFTDREIDEA